MSKTSKVEFIQTGEGAFKDFVRSKPCIEKFEAGKTVYIKNTSGVRELIAFNKAGKFFVQKKQ